MIYSRAVDWSHEAIQIVNEFHFGLRNIQMNWQSVDFCTLVLHTPNLMTRKSLIQCILYMCYVYVQYGIFVYFIEFSIGLGTLRMLTSIINSWYSNRRKGGRQYARYNLLFQYVNTINQLINVNRSSTHIIRSMRDEKPLRLHLFEIDDVWIDICTHKRIGRWTTLNAELSFDRNPLSDKTEHYCPIIYVDRTRFYPKVMTDL